jgi:hypothetical protein
MKEGGVMRSFFKSVYIKIPHLSKKAYIKLLIGGTETASNKFY